jgi:hypothetical protein
MKKLITIFIFITQFSCSQTQSNKLKEIQNFKSEILKINDSSAYYFDKGIKLLEEGKNSIDIAKSIKPKLKYFEIELDKKVRGFQKTAERLKLSNTEYENVFNELNESIKSNLEKYKYLTDKGILLK